jgi:pyridinium-3,5-bisthiocarboxylic acid mononucleotide nickel chelatase
VAKIAYFDCFSGASGDMVLGALLDAGLPAPALRHALGSLAIDYGGIAAERVLRAGISATKFKAGARAAEPQTVSQDEHVHAHRPTHAHDHVHGHANQDHGGEPKPHQHHHHSLTDIARYIERSALSREGKDRAIRLFHRLAEAEATIHQMPLERVHLHEVGDIDSIIDIVGAVYGMEWLGVDDIVASPLDVGSGMVKCAHGTFPVPAPATALLLRGVPVYAGAVKAELVTPTGALLITEYARRFGPLPEMRIDVIGYGAGDRDFPGHPNVLRLIVGEATSAAAVERIIVLECEIDDMNPQLFGPLMDALYAAGALEVFYAPVQMKKNRPGTLVTVIAAPDRREAIAGRLFAETTTIGVRYQEMLRERLERTIRAIDTPVGPIRFKVATRDGRVLNAAPEFEDCATAAAERGLSIKDVQAIATKAWLDHRESNR